MNFQFDVVWKKLYQGLFADRTIVHGSRCMLHVPPYKIGVSDRSGKYDIFHRFRLEEMNQLIAEPHNIVF